MEVLFSKKMDDAPFKKNARYADLYKIPDSHVGEIIDGDLYASPRPRPLHGRAIPRLHKQIDRPDDDDDPDGWIILVEPEVRFGKHLLVPDVAGWRRARLREIPDVVTIKITPDWVCEGLSPSTARLDKGRKREIYAKHGVDYLWYLDPERKMLDIFELDGKSYRLAKTAGNDARASFAPFTHKIDLAPLWRR